MAKTYDFLPTLKRVELFPWLGVEQILALWDPVLLLGVTTLSYPIQFVIGYNPPSFDRTILTDLNSSSQVNSNS